MGITQALLVAAALAGTSVAQKSDIDFCTSYINSLVGTVLIGAPTTPAAILSFIAQSTATNSPATITGSPTTSAVALPTTLDFEGHASQLCSIAGVLPSSLLPEFETFASELLQAGKSYSDELKTYVTDCAPENKVASITSDLDFYFTATGNICQETPTPTGASNGTYPTSNTTTTATTAILTAAAARPTGAVLGAALGALGAAAML
ncbi:hypothetical protein F5Y03DRAFT_384196 [Xylaria venustula]|nr:hypothetical protein F5Y03DRAFT_384196 [Xylaria venustula]